jgi:DNA-binding NarL/FixJ family response regulator
MGEEIKLDQRMFVLYNHGMFLLPSRLRKLLKKDKGSDSRALHEDQELLTIIQEAAQQQGRTEEEVWMDFARTGRDQYLETNELETRWDSLTEREQEVTALACLGCRNYEIAETLGISHETVKTHLQNIFTKFDIRSRKELRLALKGWRFEEWWEAHQL